MNLWENAMNELSPDLISGALEYEKEAVEKAAAKTRAARVLRKKWIPAAACLLLGLVLIGGGMLLFPKRESREGRPDGETVREPLTLPSSSDAPSKAYPAGSETPPEALLTGSETPPEALPSITEKLDDYSGIWKAAFQPEIETLGITYHTEILEGPFAGYQSSYVCEEALVGEKLGEATLKGSIFYLGFNTPTGKGAVLREWENTIETLTADVFALGEVPSGVAVVLHFTQTGSSRYDVDPLTTDHYYTYLNPAAAFDSLSDVWAAVQADARLSLIRPESMPAYTVESASGAGVTHTSYFADDAAAEAIVKALLACGGPETALTEEDILRTCDKRGGFRAELGGIGQLNIIVYRNGYLQIYPTGSMSHLFAEGLSRFFEIGPDAAEDLIRLLEQDGVPYGTEDGTVTAVTNVAKPE